MADIEYVLWNGRFISAATRWWAENSEMASDKLHCKHGRQFRQTCLDCADENDSDGLNALNDWARNA